MYMFILSKLYIYVYLYGYSDNTLTFKADIKVTCINDCDYCIYIIILYII